MSTPRGDTASPGAGADAGSGATTVRCPNCGKVNRVPATAQGTPHCGNCHFPVPWIVEARDGSFAAVAEAATVPVLVDIWAPWCGPCRMISPALEQVATEKAGQLKLVKVNADESPEISSRFSVQAIPTLLLLHRGRLLTRQVGAVPVAQLRSWVESALPKENAS